MNNEPRYPNTKLNKYPHFFPNDIPIWERFIDRYGSDFLGFDYDVKVGSGTEPVEGLGDKYASMQRILSRYRIDAVGYTKSGIWIIEVKPDAGTIAIGEVETYTKLYSRDYVPSLPVIGCIVTDRELPDMRYLTELRNEMYYVV